MTALEELSIEARECYIEDLATASQEFGPIMHLFLHHSHKLYDHLVQINEVKGHKLLWTMEDPWESDVTFDMLPHFYYVFTSDQNTALQLIKEAPGNKVFYVPHACNPKVHKPMEVTWEYKSDVCFIGNAYRSRVKYLGENLPKWNEQNFLTRLVGVGYRGVDGLQTNHVIHGHISESEMVKYYNGTKLALNLHRVSGDLDMANKRNIQPKHLNNRFYEIAAIGTRQLVVGRDDLQDEVDKVYKQKPEDFSYKARLKEYYLPLLES